MIPLGLGIIESECAPEFIAQTDIPENYVNSFLGFFTTTDRFALLKHTKSYATHEFSVISRIRQQWMSLEAAANRLPVVYYGLLANDDMRKDYVIECQTDTDFQDEFIKYQADELYRERIGHLNWRTVNLKHTFAHRLQHICKLLKIKHNWNEFPKVSLITPTYRKETLINCVKNYEKINYPSKELILVFNGNLLPDSADIGLQHPREDIIIDHVPSELFAGAALNVGHQHATGKYLFRIDDDDYYGENYILDMVLLARSVSADLFGKSPVPIVFENEKTAYIKKDMNSLLIIPTVNISSGETWIGGNTISGSNNFFKRNKYIDYSYGTADTAMQINSKFSLNDVVVFMDKFNVVAERKADIQFHTWKVDHDKLKMARLIIPNYNDLFL